HESILSRDPENNRYHRKRDAIGNYTEPLPAADNPVSASEKRNDACFPFPFLLKTPHCQPCQLSNFHHHQQIKQQKRRHHQITEQPVFCPSCQKVHPAHPRSKQKTWQPFQPIAKLRFADILNTLFLRHDRNGIFPDLPEDAELLPAVNQLPSRRLTILTIFLRIRFRSSVILTAFWKNLHGILRILRLSLLKDHPKSPPGKRRPLIIKKAPPTYHYREKEKRSVTL